MGFIFHLVSQIQKPVPTQAHIFILWCLFSVMKCHEKDLLHPLCVLLNLICQMENVTMKQILIKFKIILTDYVVEEYFFFVFKVYLSFF